MSSGSEFPRALAKEILKELYKNLSFSINGPVVPGFPRLPIYTGVALDGKMIYSTRKGLDGNLYFNSEPVTLEDLKGRDFRRKKSERFKPEKKLNADDSLTLGGKVVHFYGNELGAGKDEYMMAIKMKAAPFGNEIIIFASIPDKPKPHLVNMLAEAKRRFKTAP
eukprot:TRINITY_DN11146_c0_g2_i1.p1 TRINITY_DN11146_c0_g2~~TRINITY_DN11146_c0_g2_i1.p1  ORF type:complete len:178 (+),score=16.64 TRINITY_DN11146_c0_g2_i1:42-536(+)